MFAKIALNRPFISSVPLSLLWNIPALLFRLEQRYKILYEGGKIEVKRDILALFWSVKCVVNCRQLKQAVFMVVKKKEKKLKSLIFSGSLRCCLPIFGLSLHIH